MTPASQRQPGAASGERVGPLRRGPSLGRAGAGQPGLLERLADRLRVLRHPLATYQLILLSAATLLGLGLVMVLSASSVKSFSDTGNSYAQFTKQLTFAGLGLAGAFVVSRMPVALLKRLAPVAFGGALVLQLLVFTPLGDAQGGNRNWIVIKGQALQPSEFLKLGLVLMGALVLAHKRRQLGRLPHVIVPFLVPMTALAAGLVLAGRDLGTTMVILAIAAGMLFAAGVRLGYFGTALILVSAGVVGMVVTSANRMQRVQAWLGSSCTDPHVQSCYQKVHGQYALADGGWLGVGLGRSLEKWSWLPEAHNDFIFAIIGEELGLLGTLLVLVLFSILAYACYRLVAMSDDMFVRVAAAGVLTWVIGQAIINIGSVIGLLPIIGVPLPLISSGGSALVSNLLAVGLLIALARDDPRARDALRARGSLGQQLRRLRQRRRTDTPSPASTPRSSAP